jgi:two-component system response regulator HydG
LRIPPLRERRSDVPLLVAHFLERQKRATGIDRNISDDALKLMMNYDWPGNVRELENSLERAAALSSGPVLHIADLPTQVQNIDRPVLRAAPPGSHGVVPIAELERQAIITTLNQVKGDKLLAARLLGIGKTTLYRKLKEYGAEQ